MSFEEYERIIIKGKKTEWYETTVPNELITPLVLAISKNIIDSINKLESLNVDKKNNNYIQTLWDSVRNLPYTLNNDFYLIKKKEIESKLKQKEEKKSKTEPKKNTKNSSLIFGKK